MHEAFPQKHEIKNTGFSRNSLILMRSSQRINILAAPVQIKLGPGANETCGALKQQSNTHIKKLYR